MHNSKNIPIFLASDDNYAPFMCSAMFSILKNTSSYINFYILDGGISSESKQKIDTTLINFKNYSLEYLDMSTFALNRFPNLKHYSLNTFSRYFIPELKPDLKKILYLDVDIIVKNDIKNLFDTDLENSPIGAVPEDFHGENEKYLKENIYPDWCGKKPYFNAGILLLDIQKFIENCYSDILVNKTIELSSKLSCPDQDVFNIVFENNYKILDYKFNYMPDFKKLYVQKLGKLVQYFPTQAQIIHYTAYKPWKSKKCACKDDFWKIMRKTQFFSEIYKSYREINPKIPLKQLIFSIRNEQEHTLIRILGLKIKWRRRHHG